MMHVYNETVKFLGEKDAGASTILKIQWANGHWRKHIADILAVLSMRPVFRRLQLLEKVADEAALNAKQSDAQLFLQLVTRAASQRSWSMASFSEVPPLNWNGLLSSSIVEAQSSLQKMHGDAPVIRNALSSADDRTHVEMQASFLKTRCALCGISGSPCKPPPPPTHQQTKLLAADCQPCVLYLIWPCLRSSGPSQTRSAGIPSPFMDMWGAQGLP